MAEFDRTDPNFVQATLNQAFDAGSEPIGLVMDQPPESYEELLLEVDDARDERCDISNRIDRIMMLIAEDPHPDEIVRTLPYDTLPPAGIWFVLPDIEKITEKVKEK
jgi:hypothetical protein